MNSSTTTLTDKGAAAAVSETTYTPFQSAPDTAPVRLIVSSSPSGG